jgi:hypothetical protein
LIIIIIIIIIQERIIQVPKLSKKNWESSQWMIFVGRIVWAQQQQQAAAAAGDPAPRV